MNVGLVAFHQNAAAVSPYFACAGGWGVGLQSVLWGRKTSQMFSVGTVLVFVSKYRVTSEQTLYSNPQTLSCATPFVYTVHVRGVLRLTVSKSSSRFVFANC